MEVTWPPRHQPWGLPAAVSHPGPRCLLYCPGTSRVGSTSLPPPSTLILSYLQARPWIPSGLKPDPGKPYPLFTWPVGHLIPEPPNPLIRMMLPALVPGIHSLHLSVTRLSAGLSGRLVSVNPSKMSFSYRKQEACLSQRLLESIHPRLHTPPHPTPLPSQGSRFERLPGVLNHVTLFLTPRTIAG